MVAASSPPGPPGLPRSIPPPRGSFPPAPPPFIPRPPQVLPPAPYGLAIDGTHAYFTDFFGGRLLKAPLARGAPEVLLRGLTGPKSVAVSGGCVFWTEQGGVSALDQHGKRALATEESSPWRVAVSGEDVYWVDTERGTAKKAAKTGGLVTTLAVGLDHPQGLAVDGAFLYFSEWGNHGHIGKIALTGFATGPAPVVMIASEQEGVTSLTSDAENLYWTTMEGRVVMMPKTGGTPQALATRQGNAGCATVDDQRVYWCNKTEGAIMARDRRTGSVRQVGQSYYGIEAIAHDAARVYLVDTRTHTLVGMAK